MNLCGCGKCYDVAPRRCAKCGNLFLRNEKTTFIPYLGDWIHDGICPEAKIRKGAVIKPDTFDYMRKNYARVAETSKTDTRLTFEGFTKIINDGIINHLLFGPQPPFSWKKPFPQSDYTRTWSVPKKRNGFTADDFRILLKVARIVDHYPPPRIG